jgi:hypothetical protein
MAAQLTTMRFFAFVHGRNVDGKVVLLPEPFLTQRTGVCAMFFVYSFNMFFQVVFPLKAVRTDRTDVRLCAVSFLMHRWLMRLHDVRSEMVSL